MTDFLFKILNFLFDNIIKKNLRIDFLFLLLVAIGVHSYEHYLDKVKEAQINTIITNKINKIGGDFYYLVVQDILKLRQKIEAKDQDIHNEDIRSLNVYCHKISFISFVERQNLTLKLDVSKGCRLINQQFEDLNYNG